MHKKLVLTLMIISTLTLVGCAKDSNKHHDSFTPIEVENNTVDSNDIAEDNTENNSTEIVDDNVNDNTSSSDNSEQSVEFVQPDVDFAKQYADIVLNAMETVVSYDKDNGVAEVLDTGNTISNQLVLNVINQAALNNDYTSYNLVHTEETESDDIYIIMLDYDYWIIFYNKDTDSASGYHDGTGTLATMFGEKEEDIEYEDWD